jgi:F5/8 type C domain
MNMKKLFNLGFASAVVALLQIVAFSTPASAQDKEPLALKLPDPTLKGTPEDLPTGGPNMEPVADKPIKFMVPKGVKNVALGKPVTSSIAPFNGELSQITDGKKEPVDPDSVEFKKGVQWVQVDLGAPYEISAIALWHDHRFLQVVRGVIVQVSDDPEFKTGVTTLFNNDRENIAGQGAGTDKQYFETRFGKVIDGKGVKARYVRGYTKGSNQGAINSWEEIEVYGLPAK